MVHLGLLDQLVLLELPALKEIQGLKVHKVMQVLQDRKVPKG